MARNKKMMEAMAFHPRRPLGSSIGYVLSTTLAVILSNVIGGMITAFSMPGDLTAKMNRAQEITQHPFTPYLSVFTLVTFAVIFPLATGIVMLINGRRRKLIRGGEYGTAEWADPRQVTKELTKSVPDAERKKGSRASSEQETPSGSAVLDPAKRFSQDLLVSFDGTFTHLNNNVIIIGGPGKGKSMFALIPNILNMTSSYVVTDPKGQLLYLTGNYLRSHGYKVLSINLVDFSRSDRFNPFHYIHSLEDLQIVIDMFMRTTTEAGSASSDPYWTKAEAKLLRIIMKYQFLYLPDEQKNLSVTLDLFDEIYIDKAGRDCPFTENHINRLELRGEAGEEIDWSIVTDYKKMIVNGPEETVRCVLECLAARLDFLRSPEIRRILGGDDMHIQDLGMGMDRDPAQKVAIFCVTSDVYETYNSIASLFYTLCFKELYRLSDTDYQEGGLPVEVSFWLDEFRSIALPPQFLKYLSTCRSRNISINMIIQNIPQLKELYKDSWSQILGGCSALVYLGGNEPETYKLISEMVGKGTYDKDSWSRSGSNSTGRLSTNEDVIGRSLLDDSEARKMSYDKCIVLIEGYDAIMDYKYRTFEKAEYKQAKQSADKHTPIAVLDNRRADAALSSGTMVALTPEEIEYYKLEARSGEGHVKYYYVADNGQLVEGVPEKKQIVQNNLDDLISQLRADQLIYVNTLMDYGVKEVEILGFLTPDMSLERMQIIGDILLSTVDDEALLARYSFNPMIQTIIQELLEYNIPADRILHAIPPDSHLKYKDALKLQKDLIDSY